MRNAYIVNKLTALFRGFALATLAVLACLALAAGDAKAPAGKGGNVAFAQTAPGVPEIYVIGTAPLPPLAYGQHWVWAYVYYFDPHNGGSPITEYRVDLNTAGRCLNTGHYGVPFACDSSFATSVGVANRFLHQYPGGVSRMFFPVGHAHDRSSWLNAVTNSIVLHTYNAVGSSALPLALTHSSGRASPTSPPRDLRAGPGGGRKVSLTWKQGMENGGSPPIYYEISYRKNPRPWQPQDTGWVVVTASAVSQIYDQLGGDIKAFAATLVVSSHLLYSSRYQFFVRASNANGLSENSNWAFGYPCCAAPDRVSQIVATAGYGATITLSWRGLFYLESGGGSRISVYHVLYKGRSLVVPGFSGPGSYFGNPATYPGDPNFYVTITADVVLDEPHVFSVYAENADGYKDPAMAALATATPLSPRPPRAPVSLVANAKADDGEVTLLWAPPPDGGGAEITAYVLFANGAATLTLGGGARVATIASLQKGVAHTLGVAAQNSVGLGFAASIATTLFVAPAAPSGLTLTPHDAALRLRWGAPPFDGGASVTAFVAFIDGAATLTLSGLARAATITGLANQTAYIAGVAAQNFVGRGQTATIAGTPVPPPAAPADLRIFERNMSVRLLWNAAPSYPPIFHYEVAYGSITLVYHQTDVWVENLVNGASYSFTVRGFNAAGAGAAAVASGSPFTAPSPARDLRASVYGNQIVVSWRSSESDGGRPAFDYRFYDGANFVDYVAGQDAYTVTLTQQPAGVPITLGVIAAFQYGGGYWVALYDANYPVLTLTLPGAPAPPQSLAAESGAGFLRFTWAAPANNGGASITAYLVDVNGAASLALGGQARAASLVGLAVGESYTLGVAAQNSLAVGAKATLVFVPATPPSAPANLRALRGNGAVSLFWGAPAQLNGASITGYVAEYAGLAQTLSAAARALTITGLENGATYRFTLYVQSNVGNGATATASAKPATTPAAPAGLRAVFADGAITLQWLLVSGANAGGESVTAYIIRHGAKAATVGAVSSAVISNLTNGETVAFSVYAVNTVGESAAPATISEYPNTTPAAPTGLLAQDGNGVITLQWSAPANNGGATITAHIVEYTGGAITAATTRATLTGLSNGAPITAKVFAVNRGGRGAASAPVVATAATTPAAPASLQAAEGNGVVTLTWNAPANNGGATITAYSAEWGGRSSLVSGASLIVSGLTNGETVSFTLRARNRKGAGAQASIAAAGRSQPSAPTNLSAQRGNGVATLTWGAPAQLNGATLQGYEIAYDSETQSVGANATGYTATGLSNGTTYEFRVYAKSDYGNGATATATAKPATTPAAPANLRAAFADSAITLQWDLATGADTGGEPVTAYIIRHGAKAATVGAINSAVIGSLTNGETITFSVYAANAVGESATPATISEYANTTPAAPTGLQAQDGNGVITLQWSAPSDNGGAAITAYIVEYTGGEITAATTLATLTGLTNGNAITAKVFAVNRGGRGAASAPVVATAATTPAAPASLQAAEGDGVVTLTWNAPANNGGATITAYLAEWGGRSSLVSGASLIVSGLTNGETVSFTLRARNRKGAGAQASIAVAGRSQPSAPTNLSAQRGNGAVTLTWGAPAQLNGATLQDYEIEYASETQSVGANATGYTATGLSNGTEYEFRVYAKSDYGNGATATASAKPATTPNAPANLRAAFADSAITLQWDLVTGVASGGEPVTAYIIRHGAKAATVGAVNSAVIGSLTNGETVAFSVYAVNAVGESAAPATISEYANTTPAAPTGLQAQDGNGVITLQWTAPSDNGGAAITAYIVEYTGGTITAATNRATLTGLTNGAPITAKAFAVNRGGRGAASAPVVATAATTPAAPTGLQAQDGNGVITLQWTAPSDNGGAQVTGYIVEYTGGTLTAVTTRATLTGLTNGNAITAKVFAVNRVGGGAASAPVVATAATTPAAPANLQVAEGDGVVTLTWGAPSSTGGAAVTAYMAEWGGQSTLVSGVSLVVSGLTNGETVSFTLRALNRKGAGVAVNIAAAGRGKPSAPTAVNAVGSSGNITVTWNAPANANGAAVTAYIVSYKGTMVSVQGRSFTLSGLSAGETVRFTVQAVNSVGASDGATAEGIARDAPTAPINLSAQRGNGVVTLAWGAPAQLNGAALQGYEIVYGGQTQSVGANATGYTATGLSNGTEYEFRVYAKSDYGNGAAAITTAKPATTPASPANLRAGYANSAITLQWDLATGADTGGEPVTAYIIRHGAKAATVGAINSAVIGSLTNGETIAFSVYAVNAVGESAAPATIGEYANTTPAAPTDLQAQDGNGVITLQWTAPSDNGGAAITAYIVEYTGGTITAATNRATLTGLTNGAPITAKVLAVNRGGRGAASAPVIATAATTPAAPTGLQAQDGSGVITLQWTAPSDNGGAAITAYIVEYTGGTLTAAANRATLTGLINGAPITAKIFAVNRVGGGAASSPVVATAAATASAPTNLQVAEGDGVVTLTWGAPSNTGGAAVTAYMAEWGGQFTLVSNASLVVSGLTNGETVSFTLRALNRKGAGVAASIAAAGRGKPSAPTGVNAVGSNGNITVTWNAPTNDNGAAVTAYIVSYKGIATAVQGRGFTLSGLSAGETVRFTVQAVNSVGVSDGATAQGIARDAPTAPTNLSAQRGNGVVTLTWGAPAQLNGAALQGYEIVYGGQTQSVGANAMGYTATGLSNGTIYEFRVYAKSDYGNGAAAITTAKPATTPSAPANLRAAFADRAITLQWDLVTGSVNGGEPVTAYIIRHGAKAATVGAINSAVIGSLTNGETVAFSVYAVNAVGESAAHAIISEYPNTTPATPTGLQAQDGAGVITLQWTAPSDTGGAAITGYIVEYTGGTLTAATTRATLTGLTNGNAITAKVFAVNRGGRGASSTLVVATAATTPAAPTGLQAQDGNGVIILQWSAPSDNGGAAITGYIVEYTGGTITAATNRATLTGLTNGNAITAKVFAVNRVGGGAASSPVVATAATTASAPTNLQVAEGDGVVTLTWGAPSNTGGAAVTVYMAEWGGQSTLVLGVSLVVPGLTNGETVSFTIRARNRKGAGAAASIAAAGRGKPSAPTAVNAIGSSGNITVTWNAPTNDNGAAVTGYIVSYKGTMASLQGRSFTLSGLSAGETVRFTVQAVNSVGASDGATAEGIARDAPTAPTNLSAQRGNGVVTLAWGAPAQLNGAALQGYEIVYDSETQSVGANATGYTATGLSNGTEYEFRVYAKSDYGNGAVAITTAKPATTPAAPDNLRAGFADSAITLQWDLVSGAANGGEPVTAYIIRHGAKAATVSAVNSAVIGSLTNGETIAFSVYAVNAVGESATPAIISEYPNTTPAAPTGLQAQDGNGVITLQWTAPSNNGGAAVTGYIVEYTGGTITAATNRATLTGLTNGNAITAKVFAVNRGGRGAASAPVVATAATTPAAPTSLQAQDGNGVITLQWSAPSDNGGAAITAYIVEYTGGTITAATNRATLTGLTNGAAITAKVFAVNRVGGGAYSAPVVATAATTPAAPANLQVAEGDGVVTLTWGAPSNTGGAAVTAYMAEWGGYSTLISGVSLVVSGLTNGETVSFTLRAHNRKGLGAAASIAAAGRGKPSAPTAVNAVGSNGNITVTWNAPTNDNGAAVTGYIVSYKGIATAVQGRGFTLSGLSAGETVRFTVQAVNSVGVSEGATAEGIARDAPTAPTNLSAQRGNGVVTLAWGAPAQLNGAALQGYEIVYDSETQSVGANVTGYTATGLSNGTTYEFRVYAKSDYGNGAAAITTAKPATTPSAPASLRAGYADSAITLQWDLATGANTGGEPVTAYIIRHGANKAATVGAVNSAVIGSLTNGETVAFSVYAVNAVGESATPATISEYANTTPAAPTGLQAQDGNGVITLQWSAPVDSGGAAITAYIVEYTGGTITAATNRATLTGLSNGNAITAKVLAVNRGGRGASSAPVVATAATKASAPTNLQVVEGDGVVTLTWGAPNNTGGAAVTAYMAEWNGQSTLVSGFSFVVSGLTNGETVSFTLRARNRKGLGAAASIAAAGRGKPSAPTGVNAVGSNGNITVTWNAPANGNGATVTAYIVSYKGTMAAAQGRSFTLSGLSAGETVRFTVQAVNSVGVSEGATTEGIARDAPTAPTNLSAQRGDGVVSLTWGAPAQLNGAALQGYEIVYGGQTQSVGANATGYTATGLSNGTEYEFRVYAKSDYGNGAAAITTAKPATTPNAPVNLRAAFADSAVTLQWDLATGATNGGEPVTAYIIRHGAKAATVGAVNSAVIGSLTNGETVTFSVYAANAVGESATPATLSEYPNTTPAAPTGLQAQDGNGVITLQWNAPSDNGGAQITGYIVEYTGGTITATTNHATLTGLTNGDAITAKVFAVNRGGRGASSTPVVATAATTPAAPTGLQAQDGNGVITLQWNAPSDNGGAQITGYIVEYTGGTITATTNRATLTGLTNGNAITAKVFAVNRVGGGASSAPVVATAATTPAAPTGLQAQDGNGVITLQWSAPVDNGGAAITAYIVEYTGGTITAATNRATLTGLTNGDAITAKVFAVNRVGDGAASSSVVATAAATASAPTNLQVAEGDGVVMLTWGAPSNTGGAAVTSYMAEWGGYSTLISGVSLVVSGLTNGETVSFTLRAHNRKGSGAAASIAAAGRGKPSAPTGVNAVGSNGNITVTWNAPTNDNGAAVTGYIVSYKGVATAVQGRGFTLSGLSAGETVRFTVQAVNSVGVSDGATAEGIARDAPAAPTNLSAQRGNGVVTLAWGAPEQLNGATLQGYEIVYDSETQSVGANVTGYTATGLSNGTTYEFRVYAKSDYGNGAAALTTAKPATTPSAPASLRAGYADSAITLQWDLATGANTGGEPVTAYIIRHGANKAATVGAVNSAVIGSLTNGETVAFSVYAVNAVGESATPATISEYANTTPAAPTGLLAQDGNGVITLQWSAPSNNGGAAITAYIVEYTGGTITAATNRATLTSLSNGNPITAKVLAVNRGGRGASSAPVVATAAATASAPTNLQAAEGDGVVTLTWGAPSNTGGAAVTAYMAEWGGQSTLVLGFSLVVSGLTNGETVSFTLRALNRKGGGAPAGIAVAGRGKPSEPTAVNAVGSNGNITVTWNAPANDNGAAVTGYIVSYKGIATAVQGRRFTLSGLSAGETVRFTVQAVNSVGISDGATAQGIARDAPTAPTNLSAQRGNGVVTLTWGAPAQLNGAVLQGYEIVYGGQTQSVGANATGYTATGLSNGTEYEFRVYAKSDYGNGAAAITTAKPATTPSAPANLRAAFADRAITLQWDLATGADTGGEPVTAYIIRYGANKAATVGAVNSTVVGNLTNGETIAFSVYAVNAVGESATPATISEYPNTTPAAPTGLQAQDGNGVITLQWSAPSNNGGAAVTGYVVEYTGGTLTAATNRATLTGLTNGDAITAKVFAVNRVGGGAASSPVVATAATTASAPTNLQVAEGDGVVMLTWGAPSNTGGAAVTAYMAEWGGQSTLVLGVSLVVSGLVNGETVSFTIRARNRKGAGAAANIAAAGRGKPSEPTAVNAVGFNGNITVTWNAPANDNGAAVTAYIVSYKGIATAVQGRRFTLSGLSAGETVRFTVQAVNSVGISDGATAEGIARDAPAAPTNLSAQRGNGVVTLTWGAPAQLNGAALQGYEIVYGGQTQSVGANAAGYTATGLSNGTTYEFRVYAKSDYGNGAAATASAKPATTPNAPAGLRAFISDGAIALQWGLVLGAANGGEAVTGYVIRYGENQEMAVGAVTLAVINNLTNGEVVAFSLYAVNVVGESAAPATISEYPAAKPGAPTGLQASAGSGAVDMQWLPPASAGGAAITGYIVEYTGGALTLPASPQSAMLTGLGNGAVITAKVFAVNRAGRGAASSPVTATTAAAPDAPTGLRASSGNAAVTLAWGAPTNDNGAAVTGYVAYINGSAFLTLNAAARAATATGLTNGRQYTLGVAAQNSAGGGRLAVALATPASVAGAPQNLRVASGNGELSLTWSAPANNGGAAVTGYVVYVNGAASLTLGKTNAAVLGGLSVGVSHALGVAALNNKGLGARATTSAVPYSAPSAPQSVVVWRGAGALTVVWLPPATVNGSALRGYAVLLQSQGGEFTAATTGATILTAIIRNATEGARYTVFVRAKNAAGYGPKSAETTNTYATFARPPAAPDNLRASKAGEDGRLTLTWNPPADHGDPLTVYELSYIVASLTTQNESPATTWFMAQAAGGEAVRATTLISLRGGMAYLVSMRARNAVGYGPWATATGANAGPLAAADKAALPLAAAALARQWSEALGARMRAMDNAGAEQSGARLQALGARFVPGNAALGAAELLRQHGAALANGKKFDKEDLLRHLRFDLPLAGNGFWGGVSYGGAENNEGEIAVSANNAAFYAGVDRPLRKNLLAGAMFTHSRVDVDYRIKASGDEGARNLRINAAHPYLLWSSPQSGDRFWASFGYGMGDIGATDAAGDGGKRDVSAVAASAGARYRLLRGRLGGYFDDARLHAQVDAAAAGLKIKAGEGANSYNLRALLEAQKQTSGSGDDFFSPFALAGAKLQKDAAGAAGGWDIAGGFRWRDGAGWSGEVKAAAGGLSNGTSQWSVGGRLGKSAGAGGKGLWLALRPQYGQAPSAGANAAGDFWRSLAAARQETSERRAGSLGAQMGYGMTSRNALWQPYWGATFGAGGEYRAGLSWRHILHADLDLRALVEGANRRKDSRLRFSLGVNY